MLKSFFVLLICICIGTPSHADSLAVIKNISIKSNLFTTDKNGNLYVATNNNLVYRYDQNGDSTGFFTAIQKGKISQIDATDPLKIVLFYSNYNQLIVLDRMMSVKNSMDIGRLNIYNSNAIAVSADGSNWVYHPLNNCLQKVDDNLHVLNNSLNFAQLFAKNIDPIFMVEQDRNLFVIDSTEGILKFDLFGAYITTYHFYPKQVQFVNNQLFYFMNHKMYIYNTQTVQEKVVEIPTPEPIINARIERNRLYVQTANEIIIYKY